ncbi:MFS transporter [Streptomyces sp. Tue6028]|uniref:MFS transporter n=1 Tax=Streptomyces sp. Tue6028 TaxID=2036037 RepID=UPI003EBCEBCB
MTTPVTQSGASTAVLGDRAGRRHSAAALAAALLGFFVMTLDALIVNVALPDIGGAFSSDMSGLEWVVDGYTLTFAALLLSAGTVSDRIGARQAFGAGLAVFVIGSAACGLAPNLGVLVVARLVQGAGAAVIVPASLALIREAFPDPAKRARAISVWALGGSVGSAAGPVAGGLLTIISWRMIFFVNLPVGLLALYLLTRVPRSARREAPFDWVGQGMAVVAMGALTYGAIEAGVDGLGAPRVLVAFVVTVAAAVVFLIAQARGKHPMVPLSLLRHRTMAIAALIGFALNVAFYGMIFMLSLYLQQARGLSALGTGLAFLPMAAMTGVASMSAHRISARLGARAAIIIGQGIMVTGLILLCLPSLSAPTWLLILLMIPAGAGGALAVPGVTAVLLDHMPAERAGTASGVLNTSRQVGGALAVAVFGALVANQGQFLHGMRVSLLIAAALLVTTAMTTLLLRHSHDQ